ncbi:MAG TPA: hypothetical protein VNL91_08930 [Thermoanaerobaculia bacterium]|nr:hypothetical protein [Thermoanaerobaculia bacterium]
MTSDTRAPHLRFRFADIELSVEAGEALRREFFLLFGPGESSGAARSRVTARVVTGTDMGALTVDGDDLADFPDFLLRLAVADAPLETHGSSNGETVVALDGQPVFFCTRGEVRFRLIPRWPRVLSHILFYRMIAGRPDLMLFHAAAVGMSGRAVLLAGPKGRGKTTLSMALAARGHLFLGDETAVVDPSAKLVFPFRRPVAIKRGPAAAAVERALAAMTASFDDDGLFRTPIETVLPVAGSRPLPLGAIVLLDGFGSRPGALEVPAGRRELAGLQPLPVSLAPHNLTRRVFEMVQLLASVKIHRLIAGTPDATAAYLEEILCT